MFSENVTIEKNVALVQVIIFFLTPQFFFGLQVGIKPLRIHFLFGVLSVQWGYTSPSVMLDSRCGMKFKLETMRLLDKLGE